MIRLATGRGAQRFNCRPGRGAGGRVLQLQETTRANGRRFQTRHHSSDVLFTLPAGRTTRQGEVSALRLRLGCHHQLSETGSPKSESASLSCPLSHVKPFELQNRPTPKPEEYPPHEQYVIDVLLNCSSGSSNPKDRNIEAPTPGGILPCPSGQPGQPLVLPVLLTTIEAISHLRIHLPKDLRSSQSRETTWKTVLEVEKRFPKGIATLDPIQNMKIEDSKFKELVRVRRLFSLLLTRY